MKVYPEPFNQVSKRRFFYFLRKGVRILLNDSVLVQGTSRLANDALTALMGIIFVVCAGFFVYFMLRRAHSDEMDQKKWEKRIATDVVSLIGGELGVIILKLVLSYYGVSV